MDSVRRVAVKSKVINLSDGTSLAILDAGDIIIVSWFTEAGLLSTCLGFSNVTVLGLISTDLFLSSAVDDANWL